MRYKFKLNLQGLSDDTSDTSWDDSSTTPLPDFLGLGSNTLAYVLLGVGALWFLSSQSSAKPSRLIALSGPAKRSPRRKLTQGVKKRGKTLSLSRQSDGSYA